MPACMQQVGLYPVCMYVPVSERVRPVAPELGITHRLDPIRLTGTYVNRLQSRRIVCDTLWRRGEPTVRIMKPLMQPWMMKTCMMNQVQD